MTSPNRVSQLAGIGAFRGAGTNQYAPAAASGVPGGQATMTIFTVFVIQKFVPSINYMFTCVNAANTAGWAHYINGSAFTIRCTVANGAAASVDSLVRTCTAADLGTPLILITTLVGGNLISSVSSSTQSTAVVGYTPAAAGDRVRIGAYATTAPAAGILIAECGIMHGYDATAFASATFGAGQAGIQAMWKQDLEQGRYPTWPRVAASGSDWYWSGRDASLGVGGTAPNWPDRYTGLVCVRTGSPQSFSVPARFA